MILSDKDILSAIKKGDIQVSPFNEKNLQPASVDLHLDKEFLIFDTKENYVIDPKKPLDDMMKEITITEDKPFVLHPGEFALGLIHEKTGCTGDQHQHNVHQ